MSSLLSSPWSEQFDRLVDRAESSLILCAPYVGNGPCQRVINLVRRAKREESLSVSVLTDLSRDNMLCGSTDPAALLGLQEALPRTSIRFLPSLHAKIFVADVHEAIITSSNLTDAGLFRNLEYGVSLKDSGLV